MTCFGRRYGPQIGQPAIGRSKSYFTDYEVIVECGSSWHREADDQARPRRSLDPRSDANIWPQQLFWPVDNPIFLLYNMLEAYWNRKLTYQSDALLALGELRIPFGNYSLRSHSAGVFL